MTEIRHNGFSTITIIMYYEVDNIYGGTSEQQLCHDQKAVAVTAHTRPAEDQASQILVWIGEKTALKVSPSSAF